MGEAVRVEAIRRIDPVAADSVTADPVTADPVTAGLVTAGLVTADLVTADTIAPAATTGARRTVGRIRQQHTIRHRLTAAIPARRFVDRADIRVAAAVLHRPATIARRPRRITGHIRAAGAVQ